MKASFFYTLAFAAIVFLSAIPLALRSDEFKNNLLNHPEWRVSKLLVETELMGSESYLHGPQALALNQLRLDAWHGYHEVIHRQPFRPEQVSFRFFIAEEAWLSFIFNRNKIFARGEEQYHALRFSTTPLKSNELLQVNGYGQFLSRVPIVATGILKANTFNECLLAWDSDDMTLLLNGETIPLPHIPAGEIQHLGFRGGAKPARIDAFEVVQQDGTTYRTGFGRYEGKNRELLTTTVFRFSAYIGSLLFLLFAASSLLIRKPRLVAATLASIGFTAVLTLWPWLLIEQRLLASAYPVVDDGLQKVEERHVDEWKEAVIKDITAEFPPEKPLPENTILIMGTSQTYGCGANTPDETWTKRLSARLESEHPELQTCVINGAVPGSNSTKLLELYQDFLLQYDHKLLLIVLGCNDQNPDELQRNLGEFIDLARNKGAFPLLAIEALSDEETPLGPGMSFILEETARKYQTPLLNLHAALIEDYDRGFFWWDVVHPTSFGHSQIADVMLPFLLEHLAGPSITESHSDIPE